VKHIFIIAVIIGLSGCSTLVSPLAKFVVKEDCSLLNQTERQTTIDAVNAALISVNPVDPPTIKIHCPGDK